MLPHFIMDALIRRKALFHRLPVTEYSVRLARTLEDYENAFRLLQIGYVYQGLEPVGSKTMRFTDQHVLPEAVVLVAHDSHGHMVGTITVTLDSPAGVPLEADYRAPVAELRAEGARIAEIGSFTVVRRCWNSGVAQMLALAATRLGFLLGTSHFVAGVNPKVVPFYRAVWSFQRMGSDRDHNSLTAPVAGLVASRETTIEHLARHFTRPLPDGCTPAVHLDGGPPLPATDLGEAEGADRVIPRMPRAVFQQLFVRETDRISTLPERTQRHVRRRRSDETLGRLRLAG